MKTLSMMTAQVSGKVVAVVHLEPPHSPRRPLKWRIDQSQPIRATWFKKVHEVRAEIKKRFPGVTFYYLYTTSLAQRTAA